jgi:poly-gamma-glutamate synthesis protein (capsule biosynthesis protein)
LPQAKAVLLPAPVSQNLSGSGSHDGKLSVLFLGDMMFDRGIRAQINAHGFEYVFGPATTTIAAHDLTVANLEGPITSSASKTMLNGKAIPGFSFTFPLETANALKNAGIDIVSLANNHTLNFGQNGLNETRRALTASGVSYFGSPANSSLIATTTCISKICIGLVGWHEFAHANNKNILAAIKELRPKVDYLVVFPHWGVEYEASPTSEQRLFAHQWLDQGADAVIGAHPHVAESIEQYKGKPIFYSLGNFIFDQYFSFETTNGIGVSIELTKNGSSTSVSYSLLPFSSVGSHVSFPDATSTQKLFSQIKKVSPSALTSWLNFKTQ